MTAHNPRVSVIIPAHNAGHCLAACLESVRAQGFTSWEAIIVDDGSEDDTSAVAGRFASDKVRCERQANQGQGAARNRGLALARGEYIAFLDADDEWRPQFLASTVAFLDAHPEAIAVSTAFVVRFADGHEVVRPVMAEAPGPGGRARMLESFFDFWARYDHVRTGTALIRRAVIDEAGPQRADLRISQDLEYWGYLATFGRWGFIPEPLWVGNSRAAAGRSGWLRKYQQRRRLCPTVESWAARIVPRLQPRDRCGFEIVQGRLAAGYAHHMIIGGLWDGARRIVAAYGAAMPRHAITRLMRLGNAGGVLAWRSVCVAINVREWLKAMRMERAARVGRG